MSSADSPVAANLRRLRAARGLTQRELGELAGKTEQTVNNIETGRTQPHRATLELLAKALGADVGEFYEPVAGPIPMPEPLQEFLEEQRRKGREVTDDEVQQLREHKFRGRPTVQTYRFLLEAIRETE